LKSASETSGTYLKENGKVVRSANRHGASNISTQMTVSIAIVYSQFHLLGQVLAAVPGVFFRFSPCNVVLQLSGALHQSFPDLCHGIRGAQERRISDGTARSTEGAHHAIMAWIICNSASSPKFWLPCLIARVWLYDANKLIVTASAMGSMSSPMYSLEVPLKGILVDTIDTKTPTLIAKMRDKDGSKAMFSTVKDETSTRSQSFVVFWLKKIDQRK